MLGVGGDRYCGLAGGGGFGAVPAVWKSGPKCLRCVGALERGLLELSGIT